MRLSSVNCTRVEAISDTSCEGEVRNVSQLTLTNVDVVIEWLVGSGEVAETDRAPIAFAFKPMLPGETSGWLMSQASYNPEFAAYRVSFAGPDGPIPADGP